MKDTFKGLKVIELSSILAGPLVGSFFAELGAEVIKIENKRQGGDATRQWRLPDEGAQPVSAYYASANYGKQSEMLDLSDEADRSKVYAYVKDSDIVITNFQKKTAEKITPSSPSSTPMTMMIHGRAMTWLCRPRQGFYL